MVYTPPLVVAPIGKTTQLQALQFVQSKTELLPDAQPALEQLLAIHAATSPPPKLNCRAIPITRAISIKNLLLSKQRVDVVKDYLVKNGIAAKSHHHPRLRTNPPHRQQQSEATRQLNRRVEMIVVKQ